MSEELTKYETKEIAIMPDTNYTPSALVQLAIQKDVDLERLSKLLDLQERWEKNEAKKAYVTAMSMFKKAPPQIIKDMHVEFATSHGKTSYNHASLGNVVASLTEGLSKYDLSTNWDVTQTEKTISVTNIITHIGGHSEKITITAPPDVSGGKNLIQQIASTITYLQRYTLLANAGLATNEFENDGRTIEQPVGNKSKPKNGNGAVADTKDFLDKTNAGCDYLAKHNAIHKFDSLVIGLGYNSISEITGKDKQQFFLKKLREEMNEVGLAAKKAKEEAEKAMEQEPERTELDDALDGKASK